MYKEYRMLAFAPKTTRIFRLLKGLFEHQDPFELHLLLANQFPHLNEAIIRSIWIESGISQSRILSFQTTQK